ncbi:MAG: hypothetical protein ACI8RD_003250 [Bacillariaceae sp.]|jgi:hypothetical protein
MFTWMQGINQLGDINVHKPSTDKLLSRRDSAINVFPSISSTSMNMNMNMNMNDHVETN